MTLFDSNVQNIYNNIRNNSPSTSHSFAILKLAVNPNNNQLRDTYEQKVQAHNNSILNNPFADSGFDLFVPENTTFTKEIETKFIDFQVKTEMVYCDVDKNTLRNCV